MPSHTAKKRARRSKITKAKATKILRHGKVRGSKLTPKARRFMGARSR